MMRLSVLIAGIMLLVLSQLANAADGPRFIGDLEASPERWKALEGIPIEIEGRVSTVSRGELRMQGSRLPVRLPEDEHPRGGRTYKLRGEMRAVDGRTVFVARTISEFPSDEERLRLAESRLSGDKPNALLDLADEYLRRAKYYHDEKLEEQARRVAARGLSALAIEAGEDVEKLAAAAALATERGFDDVATATRHRSARIEWSDIKDRLANDTQRATTDAELLIDRLGRDLPGALEPLNDPREALASAYRRDPFGVYSRVDAEQRKMIARFLYSEIVEGVVTVRLLPGDSNADAIADELAKRLPDRPDLVAEYREKAIASAMDAIGNLSETDMLALVARLKKNDDSKRATKALDGWLDSRLETARQRGPQALFDVAQDYVRLKNDEDTAVELYQEALKIDDRLIGAERALSDLGYEKIAGKWRKRVRMPSAAATIPDIKLGEIREGMNDAQVRASLRTSPDSVVRIASFGEVTEIWVYNDFKRVVTLRRNAPDGEARVVEVADLE